MIREIAKAVAGMAGYSNSIDPREMQQQMEGLLVSGEKVEGCYRLVRDLVVLTNKRIILLDKQGVTGRKVQYRSVPYREVSAFEIESAGTFDADAELKVWVRGRLEPLIAMQFAPGQRDILRAQEILASKVLG